MNRSFVYGGIAVLVVGIIIGAYLFFQLPEPDAPVATSAPAETETTSTVPAEPAAPTPVPPSFDVVRVDENGNVVIAGRATPGCEVIVRDGDIEIGRVTADRAGEWVLVPEVPLAAGERQFSLFAECEGAAPVQAERVIALAVPERDGSVVAVAVPREGAGAAEVLQRPSLAGAPVAVGAVDYDDDGNTTLSGVAAPNSTVRVYLNNELVGTVQADESGRWSLTLDRQVSPGSYNLRVDQVDSDGQVVARSEIPFVRAEPLRNLPAGRVVIIQPGDHLWRIASQRYGSGFQYTLIYDANKDQIRNPDLIYPGQVFTLPAAK
ncbi:MAG: Ig-like domain-containing protein [Alphaproteobacteria bacterium]